MSCGDEDHVWTFEIVPTVDTAKRRWILTHRDGQRVEVAYYAGREPMVWVEFGRAWGPSDVQRKALAGPRAECHKFLAHAWASIAEAGPMYAEPEYLASQNVASVRVCGRDAALCCSDYFGEEFADSMHEVVRS